MNEKITDFKLIFDNNLNGSIYDAIVANANNYNKLAIDIINSPVSDLTLKDTNGNNAYNITLVLELNNELSTSINVELSTLTSTTASFKIPSEAIPYAGDYNAWVRIQDKSSNITATSGLFKVKVNEGVSNNVTLSGDLITLTYSELTQLIKDTVNKTTSTPATNKNEDVGLELADIDNDGTKEYYNKDGYRLLLTDSTGALIPETNNKQASSVGFVKDMFDKFGLTLNDTHHILKSDGTTYTTHTLQELLELVDANYSKIQGRKP